MQYANVAISASCSVQSEIVPCARALRQTQPVPCQSTYEWMCARRGHSIARGECMQSSNHFPTPRTMPPTISNSLRFPARFDYEHDAEAPTIGSTRRVEVYLIKQGRREARHRAQKVSWGGIVQGVKKLRRRWSHTFERESNLPCE